MSIRRNIGTMPDNSPTVVGSYVFDNPLNIAAPSMERADIKPMRIELFDFLPFHVNPSKLARVQLRITMTTRDCDALSVYICAIHIYTTHTHTYTTYTSSDSYCIVQKSVDNNLVVYCEDYDGQ